MYTTPRIAAFLDSRRAHLDLGQDRCPGREQNRWLRIFGAGSRRRRAGTRVGSRHRGGSM